MNVDDGIRGRMARAPAIFAKGHVVAPAQIIYLKRPNSVTVNVKYYFTYFLVRHYTSR